MVLMKMHVAVIVRMLVPLVSLLFAGIVSIYNTPCMLQDQGYGNQGYDDNQGDAVELM